MDDTQNAHDWNDASSSWALSVRFAKAYTLYTIDAVGTLRAGTHYPISKRSSAQERYKRLRTVSAGCTLLSGSRRDLRTTVVH